MGIDISKWPWKTWLLSTGATAVTGVVVACVGESSSCAAINYVDASADARTDADAQVPLPDAGDAGDAADASSDAPDAD